MKNKTRFFALLAVLIVAKCAFAQDTVRYQLRASAPLLDYPQNKVLSHRYPSMHQALESSTSLYELGYFGIQRAGDALFKPKRRPYTFGRKAVNFGFKYLSSLALVKYGNELPISLGVWAHEGFHRSVLGVNGIASKKGNWFPHRWDGTVYGIDDAQLARLKADAPSQLLYAYVAGVHSEVLMNERIAT